MASPHDVVKRVLLGKPIVTEQAGHSLLPKFIALPVFASDALSSVAYAPDEVLNTLSLAGVGAVALSPWVGLMVGIVMLTVVMSYRQNVHAYPSGGGDYEIASDNLSVKAGMGVASALLADYMLTVAVSISSGTQFVIAISPGLKDYAAPISIAIVAIIAMVNLRGVRESGKVFAVPVYGFIAGVAQLLFLAPSLPPLATCRRPSVRVTPWLPIPNSLPALLASPVFSLSCALSRPDPLP